MGQQCIASVYGLQILPPDPTYVLDTGATVSYGDGESQTYDTRVGECVATTPLSKIRS